MRELPWGRQHDSSSTRHVVHRLSPGGTPDHGTADYLDDRAARDYLDDRAARDYLDDRAARDYLDDRSARDYLDDRSADHYDHGSRRGAGIHRLVC